MQEQSGESGPLPAQEEQGFPVGGVGCFVFPRIYLYFPWNGVEWGDQTREVLT